MAATITHFVLADKIFEKYFNHLKKNEFFIGNIFPDIRYIGVIEREKTHIFEGGLKDISLEDSFLAGTQFHRLTDKIEAKFAEDNGVYALFPQMDYATQSMKLFSDKILYHKVENWLEYALFFKKILSGERQYGINDKDINKWHQMVSQYISHEPNPKSWAELIKQTTMPESSAKIVINNISKINSSSRLSKIIMKFYDNFEELLNKN